MRAATSATRSAQLCGEVGVGGTAGAVVVEGLGDITQRLGMVEDAHRGTSSQAVIKRRRPRGAASRAQWPCLRGEAVSKPKLRPVLISFPLRVSTRYALSILVSLKAPQTRHVHATNDKRATDPNGCAQQSQSRHPAHDNPTLCTCMCVARATCAARHATSTRGHRSAPHASTA